MQVAKAESIIAIGIQIVIKIFPSISLACCLCWHVGLLDPPFLDSETKKQNKCTKCRVEIDVNTLHTQLYSYQPTIKWNNFCADYFHFHKSILFPIFPPLSFLQLIRRMKMMGFCCYLFGRVILLFMRCVVWSGIQCATAALLVLLHFLLIYCLISTQLFSLLFYFSFHFI